jgi:hypothetical protein
MKTYSDKTRNNTQTVSASHDLAACKSGVGVLQDNRPETSIQRKKNTTYLTDNHPQSIIQKKQAETFNNKNISSPFQLLAHETWHVVQQKQGRVRPTKQLKSKVSINDDASLEKEADVMGNKALQFRVEKNDGLQKNKSIRSSGTAQLMPWYKKLGIGVLAAGGAVGGALLASSLIATAGLSAVAAGAVIGGGALVGGIAGGLMGYGAHRAHLSHLGYGHEMEHGLPEQNIHYGINNYGGHQLGVREPAMANHGGTVAEYAWDPPGYPAHAQTPFDAGIRAFNQSFNRQIPGPAAKYTGAGMNNTPIPAHLPGGGGASKLIAPDAPTMAAADAIGDYDLLTRQGTRFSKSSIIYSVLQGGTPRFHLDGMGNEQQIQQILNKQGPHTDSVTSRELRFIHRYWDRDLNFTHGGAPQTIRFNGRVKFYRNSIQVQAPWEDH